MPGVSARARAGIVALCLAPLLAACGQLGIAEDDDDERSNGVATMKVAEALAAADEAMEGLEDVTYLGNQGLDTQRGRKRVPISMTIVDGQGCQLYVGSNATGHLTMRLIGRSMYIRGDDTAIRQVFGLTGQRAEVIRGKWVKAPADKEVRQDCTLEELVPDGAERRTFKARDVEDVDGTEARRFDGRDDGDKLSIWIATKGDPYVVRAKGTDESGPFAFTLDRTDDGLDLERPPRSEIVG